MSEPAILAEQLTKTYRGSEDVLAVRSLDLRVEASQRVAVVGRSGSGKSTLLNLLAGLDRPTSGVLQVAGKLLHAMTPNEMTDYRLRSIGVIFQAFQLIPQRSALQNVELPLILGCLSPKERREKAEHWLNAVGLSHRLAHYPYQLSGGEQQRVAIARALVNEPEVVLADEPTGNLDSATADGIVALITDLCDQTQATFLLVTHDLSVADRICSRMLTMADGVLRETAHANR